MRYSKQPGDVPDEAAKAIREAEGGPGIGVGVDVSGDVVGCAIVGWAGHGQEASGRGMGGEARVPKVR